MLQLCCCLRGTLLLHCDLTKRSACIPEEMAVGKTLHCWREGECPVRPHLWQRKVLTLLPLQENHPCMCAEASGTWQLLCYQMQHMNRVQEEIKIPSGRSSAQKWGERKGNSKLLETCKYGSNPRLEGTSWNTPGAWHEDSKRFLGHCGPALPFCQPIAQAHFLVFGVRSRGVPSRWMAPLPVLEQRRDSTAGDTVPVTRSGTGIKGWPLCCHGNRNARQR